MSKKITVGLISMMEHFWNEATYKDRMLALKPFGIDYTLEKNYACMLWARLPDEVCAMLLGAIK